MKKERFKKVDLTRLTAWRIVQKVNQDGRRLEEYLANELASVNMDIRDRALVSEIAYGVCRWRRYLDFILTNFLDQPIEKLHPGILNLLRVGSHQILFLNRVPDRAAVHTAVDIARLKLPKFAPGLTNAVLRRVSDSGRKINLPDCNRSDYLGITFSHPDWLVEQYLDVLGPDETSLLLQANNSKNNICLRVNLNRLSLSDALKYLNSLDITGHPGEFSPCAIVIDSGKLDDLTKLKPNIFTHQSESSQLIGYAVSPAKNAHILDLCAGIGGKSFHLAEIAGSEGSVTAVESSRKRFDFAIERMNQSLMENVTFIYGDARDKLTNISGNPVYDYVLVDAPCTGIGTIRSRPDIKWHVNENDAYRFAKLQNELLLSGADKVKNGGCMVYSVCSTDHREGEDVISRFLTLRPDFTIQNLVDILPNKVADLVQNSGFLRTWPHRHNLDGFFAARLIKTGS